MVLDQEVVEVVEVVLEEAVVTMVALVMALALGPGTVRVLVQELMVDMAKVVVAAVEVVKVVVLV